MIKNKYIKKVFIIVLINILLIMTVNSTKIKDKRCENIGVSNKKDSNVKDISREKIDIYKETKMIVTAYTLDYKCCGKYPWDEGYAVTASGKIINEDIFSYQGIIAAPIEFPFGTILEVEGWGIGTVCDRGSLIKWNKESSMYQIDIYFDNYDEAINWGRKIVNVKILN